MKKVVLLAALLFPLLGCNAAARDATSSPELVVRRGDFQERFLLTGEIEAAKSDPVVVPQLPGWVTAIQALVDDGTQVRQGDVIARLDNAQVTAGLADKRLAYGEALRSLAKERASLEAELAEKAFEVTRRSGELERYRMEAAVPPSIVSQREVEERKLRAARAESDYLKALTDRDVLGRARGRDIANLEMQVAKTAREIAVAEEAIEALALKAPTSGIVIIGEEPREGRKLQVGDSVWSGLTVARIPDTSSLQVTARLWDVDDRTIAVGQEVDVVIDAYPDRLHRGRVIDIAKVAQEPGWRSARRFFHVTIALDTIDPETMRPGYSVRAAVRRMDRGAVLLVPRTAVDFSQTEPRVRRADRSVVTVDLGPCNAHECVVESGLREGDQVMPFRTREGA